MPMKSKETIVAIATPPGQGGIGVLRLSGPKAKAILARLWINKDKSVDKFESHRLYLGKIVDDSALTVWMKAPHSYTGEDVVEIQAHGSQLLLEKILDLCLRNGARLAGPGEFTERAYLNGKLDLAQAEAVADVISATSEAGLKNAQEQLSGKLSGEIKKLQKEILQLRAFVEATIDFPEEDIEMIRGAQIQERLQPIQEKIDRLIASHATGKKYREGVTVVLAGRPNAGKSSLFNALLREDRAIVHDAPGTTRDVIEESVVWEGLLFRLIDTAGMRDTAHAVEAMGVARTQGRIESADFVLWLMDGSTIETEEDQKIRAGFDPHCTLVVVTKSDLPQQALQNVPVTFCNKNDRRCLSHSVMQISAKTGEGLEGLRKILVERIRQQHPQEGGGVVVTRLRHKEALESGGLALRKASIGLQQRVSSEFVAEHLKEANKCLGSIIGEVTTEDLLGEIFSKFCIGK